MAYVNFTADRSRRHPRASRSSLEIPARRKAAMKKAQGVRGAA